MKNLHKCPCCGEKTLKQKGMYEICDICEWEDDPWQADHPDSDLGANTKSLNDYREQWKDESAKQTA